jgi:transcriptional regulator with XRE-family HTH domain
MTKRARPEDTMPTLVNERLRIWGQCVRKQRVQQNITARDLCARLDISHPTLQRMERGEASVNVGLFLAAFHVLGILAITAPEPDVALWQMDSPNIRSRANVQEHDDGYF